MTLHHTKTKYNFLQKQLDAVHALVLKQEKKANIINKLKNVINELTEKHSMLISDKETIYNKIIDIKKDITITMNLLEKQNMHISNLETSRVLLMDISNDTPGLKEIANNINNVIKEKKNIKNGYIDKYSVLSDTLKHLENQDAKFLQQIKILEKNIINRKIELSKYNN